MIARPSLSKTPNTRIGRTDLEVRQLRAFVAVVREGSVSRAAAVLGLAQSTVSEAIAALDRALGAPTLHRHRGAQRMSLTAAGRALLPHAERTLRELAAAQAAVAEVTRTTTGDLELIANESVSTYLLPPVLAALRKAWPHVKFSVRIETCAAIRREVADGHCDIGLLLEENRPAPNGAKAAGRAGEVERIELSSPLPLVIFGSARHPLVRAGARSVTRDALANHPIFVPDATGDLPHLLTRYFSVPDASRPSLEAVGTIDGVRRAVAGDEGALGILPSYTLTDDVRSAQIRVLVVEPALPTMKLVALLPHGATARHPALGELVEGLRRDARGA